MKPPGDRQRIELLADDELADLIREVLQEQVGTAEPSPRAWAHIRAQVEADRVPIWLTWWRRLQLAFSDTMPRLIPNAIVVSLFILLGGIGLRGYGWLDNMIASGPGFTTSNERQIAMAERRFYDQYRIAYIPVPVDAPPKGIRRAPRVPAPPTGPIHLAVGAMDPS